MKTTQIKLTLLSFVALAAAFFLGLAQSAQAIETLPLYEPFAPDYTNNAGAISVTNANGVTALGSMLTNAAAWTGRPANSANNQSPMASLVGKMTYSSLDTTNGDNIGVQQPGYTGGSTRTTGIQFTTNNTSGDTVYASFLLDLTAAPTANRWIASLTDTTTQSAGSGKCLLMVDANKRLVFTKNSVSAFVTNDTVLTLNTTNLIVMRYTFTAGTTNDEMALWVNPSSSTFSAPSAPTANTNKTSGTDMAALSYFYLEARNAANAGTEVLVDELRIANTWAAAVPGVCSQPTVSNPSNVTNFESLSATFTVTDGGLQPTNQWQVSTDTNVTWASIADATNTSYTISGLTTADSGKEYRCIVNTACSNSPATSAPAILIVNSCVPVAVTTQPTNISVSAGTTATFHVAASGSLPSYQWQVSYDTNVTWANVTNGSGGTTVNYTTPTLNATISDDSQQYRCVVTNGCDGSSDTSTNAILSVYCTPAGITTQPSSMTTAVGVPGTFSIVASGSVPTYQWYTNTVADSGATNSTYVTPAALATDDGMQVYCAVTTPCDGFTTNSDTVTMSVGSGTDKIYQSTANGNWNVGTTWQWSFNGGATWLPAQDGPTAANSTNILVQHTVTVTTNVSVDQATVSVAGNLTIQAASSNAMTVADGSGTDLDVFGTVTAGTNGYISIASGAVQVYESGGKLSWNNPVSQISLPVATWSTGSTMEFRNGTAANYVAGTPSIIGLNQNFYNFTFNAPVQTKTLDLAGALTNVSGNLTITNGIVNFNASNTSVTNTVNIGGSLILGTGAKVFSAGGKANTAEPFGIWQKFNIGGDFIMGGSATLQCTSSNTGVSSDFIFNGGGTQHLNLPNSLNNAAKYHWKVAAGSSLQLLTSFTTTEDASGNTRFDVDGTLDLNGKTNNFRGFGGASTGVVTNSGVAVPLTVGLAGTGGGGNDTYSGIIAGGVSLTKSGTNTVTLTGANTYTGNTTISAGTVALTGTGSIDSSPTISLASGTVLDVTGHSGGAIALGSSQTLSGNGQVSGTVDASGTVSAGTAGGLTVTTLHFLSGSTNRVVIDPATPTNSLINCASTVISAGATLTGSYSGIQEAAFGDSYRLFSSAASGSFTTVNLPTVTGKAWSYSPTFFQDIDVVCVTISVTGTLPPGTLGVSNGVIYAAANGTPAYTFSYTGTLPTGMTLDADGNLHGTPTASGEFIYTVIATDSSTNSCTGSLLCTNNVSCPAITVAGVLPDGVVSTAYAATNTASGGSSPYTFGVGVGFPPGLTLAANGEISGTPTNSGVFSFTVTATDIYGCTGSSNYTVNVSCPTFTLGAVTNAVKSAGYTNPIVTTGGTAPYTYAVTGGGLPVGLALTTNGVLKGKVTTILTTNFTVTATDVYGCTGSSNYTFVVVASGVDTNGPTVVFKSPLANGYVEVVSITVTGTVADVNLITNVSVSVDGGAATNATLFGASPISKTWSLNVGSPTPGTHYVLATGTDMFGNSKTASNSFFYGVRSTLTTATNGEGTLLGAVTAYGQPTNGASLVIGKPYKITLTVGGNYLLSNVVNSASGVTNLQLFPKTYNYVFTMQSNLTLTVNFVTNRFFHAVGSYSGLFQNGGDVTLSNMGFFTAKVAAKSNKLASASGSVYVNGFKESFSITSFNLDGVGTSKVINRSMHFNTNNPLTVQLVLPLDGSDDTVTGTISSTNEGWAATMAGDKAIATNAYAGTYTLVIPPVDVNDSTNQPGGYGYGLVTIDTNGVAAVKASQLADNQVFKSIKANVSKDGQWPLFSQANKDAVTKQYQSQIMGWVTVGGTNGLEGTNLVWVRSASANGRYSNGFTNAPLVIQASPYADPGTNQVNITLTTNALVTVQGGGMTNVLSHSVALVAANKFSFGTGTNNPNVFKLTLTPKTGKLGGTVAVPLPSGLVTVTYYGALLTNVSSGYGFLISPVDGGAGATNISGALELTP